MDDIVLRVENVRFGFAPDRPVLDGIGFTLRKGEFVSLLGPSGTGKSTLFKLICGLVEPQGGRIELYGDSEYASMASGRSGRTDGRTGRAGRGGKNREGGCVGRVGYMPQKDNLLPWRTVLRNATLGLEVRGVPRREAESRALELIRAFGLEGSERKYPHELSGGMRQRVSFLRTVLGGEPLLLDEPFSALDAMTRLHLQEWLLGVWERHRRTVLFITHDIEEALLLSDRVLVAAGSPVRELRELPVPLARPRDFETTLSPEFAALKRKLRTMIDGRERP